MSSKDLRDKIAIVGVGDTDYGDLYRHPDPDRTADQLAAAAFSAAVVDSGIDKSEIDGLICSRVSSYPRMATVLGMPHPKMVHWLEGSGRLSGVAVQMAIAAISSGMVNTVALVYGNDGRSRNATYGGFNARSASAEDKNSQGNRTENLDLLYGMTSPGAYTSMMYRRYQDLYNVPDGALAPIAISNRRHASLNPRAVMREPLTRDAYESSRFIAEPMRLFDYCLINDGAVALILTSADRARQLAKPPVYISGTAAMGDLNAFQHISADCWYGVDADVATRLYDAAGIGPDEVDSLQIYDCFTPHVLFGLEGFGHCPRGESWQWVADGRIEFDGEKPINTSGGHTSESYMQGWGLHVEAVRQLRGEAEERQVADCRVVQYIGQTPLVTSHILRSDP
jgi:acetyl-CoA acetyltransferase